MKRVLCSLIWFCSTAVSMAEFTSQQLKDLEQAKKQFEAGLVSQTIYEEMQRKILSLPAPAVPAAIIGESAVLAKLTSGYWRLQFTMPDSDLANRAVLRFQAHDGRLHLTRFKTNEENAPGQGEEVPLTHVSIEPKRLSFAFAYMPGQTPTDFRVTLNDKGTLEIADSASDLFGYRLNEVTVRTEEQWNSWFSKNPSGNDLLRCFSDISEIWRSDGAPEEQIPSDGFIVWYNAVELPRTSLDDFRPTLRPLIVKLKESRIAKRFDYSSSSWRNFPEVIPQTSLDEVMIIRLTKGEINEAQWDEYAQQQRNLYKTRGTLPMSKIPLEEGGILRSKFPHGPIRFSIKGDK